MSSARIRARAPAARAIAVAKLTHHALVFHKAGKDGSAKCDIFETRNLWDIVYGVVFEIDPAGKSALDMAEGLGFGYREKQIQVIGEGDALMTAVTYFATDIDTSLKPFHWYKEHVVRGAREHGLPNDYVVGIEQVEAVADPDRARHEKETRLYC